MEIFLIVFGITAFVISTLVLGFAYSSVKSERNLYRKRYQDSRESADEVTGIAQAAIKHVDEVTSIANKSIKERHLYREGFYNALLVLQDEDIYRLACDRYADQMIKIGEVSLAIVPDDWEQESENVR